MALQNIHISKQCGTFLSVNVYTQLVNQAKKFWFGKSSCVIMTEILLIMLALKWWNNKSDLRWIKKITKAKEGDEGAGQLRWESVHLVNCHFIGTAFDSHTMGFFQAR